MRDRTTDVDENGFTDLVLVCTNDRDADFACCADARGPAVYEAITSWLRERGVFWSHVYVVQTSCLGLCSADGTAVAIHPRGRWYSDVLPGDVPDLLEGVFGDDASKLGVTSAASPGATPSGDAG